MLAATALIACSKPADTNNGAVNVEQNRPSPAPTSGNNSFTQAQAQDHLANAGFTNVTGLTQDDKGVWRGQATKDGKVLNVAVDYTGAVTTS
jgi:hypothetical protein